jgi:hypothetical protein
MSGASSFLIPQKSWEMYTSCFVFVRSRVQVSARRLVILTEVLRGFYQFLQADAWYRL